MDTDEQRDESKGENEGRPLTSHILISLTPYKNDAHQYFAIAEQGISRATLERYLNFLLRACAKQRAADFEHPSPSGARKKGKSETQKYVNTVELQGHPSADLTGALESGKIRGITLETHDPKKLGTGEGRSITPRRVDLKLGPVKAWTRGSFKDAISLGKKRDYEHARVMFQSADAASHTALVDIETENVIGDSFIETRRLVFDDKKPEAAVTFDPQIIGKIDTLMTVFGKKK